MSGYSILGVADDLTGAIEIGTAFAEYGFNMAVTIGRSFRGACVPDIDGLIVDTETRHSPPQEARRAMTTLASVARHGRWNLIFKKTDSTLRGNIASELDALASGIPEYPVIYAPAYPRTGRTVRQGWLYVDGQLVSETSYAQDPLNPVTEASIPLLLAREAHVDVIAAPSAPAGPLRSPAIYVLDGESDSDLQAAATSVVRVAAGTAGFAQAIAAQLGSIRPPSPAPNASNCLVVNGTLHEASVRQVAHAQAAGWPLALPADVASVMCRYGWVILRCDNMVGTGVIRAGYVGRLVREILAAARIDLLVIFGGDTAFGVLNAIGRPIVRPIQEILPGAPLASVRLPGRDADLWVVTKGGGLGPVDFLPRLREQFERRT